MGFLVPFKAPPRDVFLLPAMCQAPEGPPAKRVRLSAVALANAKAPGKGSAALTSFASFCTGNSAELAFLGDPTPTQFGLLFLQDKAASMYLESVWSSEKKATSTLMTNFQQLKKGLRDAGVLCPWAVYKASAPEPVQELFRRLAKDVALDPETPSAKMEGYLLPEEIQYLCAKELARDLQNPLAQAEIENLLYLRIQAARSHRSSDLMRITLAGVSWKADDQGATPIIDISTLKPVGGKTAGQNAKVKAKIGFYIVDQITRTAGQIPYKSHRNPLQIQYKFYRNPLQIPLGSTYKSLTNPMEIPYKSHRDPKQIHSKTHGDPLQVP